MLEDNGEEVFVDPNRVPLKEGEAKFSEWLTDSRWADLTFLPQSPLFETPIKRGRVPGAHADDRGGVGPRKQLPRANEAHRWARPHASVTEKCNETHGPAYVRSPGSG
jgi:hypothetical protein